MHSSKYWNIISGFIIIIAILLYVKSDIVGQPVVNLSGLQTISGPYLKFGGTNYITPFFRVATIPPTLSFKNTKGSSTQTVNSDGSVTFTCAPVANDNLVMLGTNIGGNTTLTVAMNCNWWNAAPNAVRCGVAFRESSGGGTNKIETLDLTMQASGIPLMSVNRWTNQTTYSGGSLSSVTSSFLSPVMYFKIRKTGGNLFFSMSNDGISYSEEISEAQTIGFTVAPDQWGVVLSPGQTVQTLYSQILSYQEN